MQRQQQACHPASIARLLFLFPVPDPRTAPIVVRARPVAVDSGLSSVRVGGGWTVRHCARRPVDSTDRPGGVPRFYCRPMIIVLHDPATVFVVVLLVADAGCE